MLISPASLALGDTKHMATPPPRKKLRQAAEERGKVSTLCFSCRRTEDRTTQQGLAQFFKAAAPSAARPPPSSGGGGEAMLCSKCRRSMEQKVADRTGGSRQAATSRVLPQIARLRQYQRLAAEQGVPFAIAEGAAAEMMREACTACGAPAPVGGHGLTRLRVWPEGMARPERGGFMGPFAPSNLATACSTCNLMKVRARPTLGPTPSPNLGPTLASPPDPDAGVPQRAWLRRGGAAHRHP